MTTTSREPAAAGDTTAPAAPRRGAAATRRLLLEAARHRFAADGYSATTVRAIADEAGVNVSLINRYFDSKEGLFQACLVTAVDELGRTVDPDATLADVAPAVAAQLAGPDSAGHPNQLLLLLRTSGDDRAEAIRLDTLRAFSVRLATVAGWREDGPDSESLLLHAEVALAAVLGIALLRSSGLEPLRSAGAEELTVPLRGLVAGLLPRRS